MRLSILAAVAASATMLLASPNLPAQGNVNWPTRPVTLIIPLTAGGPGDREMRPYMQKPQENTRQPYVLDFKAGGNSVIGNLYVAKAKPDGYTYLVSASGLPILPAFTPDLPYDTIRDFAPVSLVTKRAMMLVVHSSVPVNTYQEYIAYAKANPGKLNWGTAARGGVTHLVGAWLHSATNTEVTFIHYKGSAPYVIDIVAGRLDVVPMSLGTGAPHFKSGTLKPLALMTVNRIPALPNLAPIAEMGVPGYEYPSWLGVLTAAGTPAAIVSKFSAELAKAVKSPDLAADLEKNSITAIGSTPDEFRQVLVREVAQWKKLVTDLKIESSE